MSRIDRKDYFALLVHAMLGLSLVGLSGAAQAQTVTPPPATALCFENIALGNNQLACGSGSVATAFHSTAVGINATAPSHGGWRPKLRV